MHILIPFIPRSEPSYKCKCHIQVRIAAIYKSSPFSTVLPSATICSPNSSLEKKLSSVHYSLTGTSSSVHRGSSTPQLCAITPSARLHVRRPSVGFAVLPTQHVTLLFPSPPNPVPGGLRCSVSSFAVHSPHLITKATLFCRHSNRGLPPNPSAHPLNISIPY